MATRTRKATIVDVPSTEQPQAVPEATLFEQLTAQIPDDWRRRCIAVVAGLATSFATGYAVAAVTEYAILSALLLTGSGFLAMLILLLGCIMAMYLGSRNATFVYTKVMSKSIDRAFSSANTTVRGWFTTTKGATA